MKRFVGKLVVGMIVLLWMVIFSLPALAVEFSADSVQERFGHISKGKVYIKGNKMRMEGTEAGKKSIMISDLDKGTAYVLMPEDKMYFEMSGILAKAKMNRPEADEELAKIADKKLVGKERVNGYLCDKYEIIYHDKSLGKMFQWFSKKLNFPIKMVYTSSHGKMITEYKNIKEGGVSNSLFEIPSGYQKMDVPGMGQVFNSGETK